MASFLKEELQCRQTQFLSTAGFSNKMKFKSRLPPFSLICIWCWRMFCFCFVVFYLWVNSDDITRWHAGWFQIPYLGSCPLSIGQKISLISLDWPENITDQFGKMSGQSDTGTNLPDPYGFVRIWFQINCVFFSSEFYSQTGHYWL